MTRGEIFANYPVSPVTGRIRDGLFAGQAVYVPHFWQRYVDGQSDGGEDNDINFIVLLEEKEEFPELGDKAHVVLRDLGTHVVEIEDTPDFYE